MKKLIKIFTLTLIFTTLIPISPSKISFAAGKNQKVITKESNTLNKQNTKQNNKQNTNLKKNTAPQKNSNNKPVQNKKTSPQKNLEKTATPKPTSTSQPKESAANSSSNDYSNSVDIPEKEVTPSDWKISVDDNKNGDFSSIQNANSSKNPFNDGHNLLIIGIILVSLSGIGLITFTILLIKRKRQ